MQSNRTIYAALFFGLLAGSPAAAQTTEADLSARLVGKPLFLRGFWMEDQLKFDTTGTPQGHATAGSFTTSGVRVTSVSLKGDKLLIQGLREGLEFEPDGSSERVTLNTKPGSKKPEKIGIVIEGAKGLPKAVDAIFAGRLTDLIPSLPPFWQRYARANFSKQDEPEDPDSPRNPDAPTGVAPERGTMHVGGNVRPPKVIHQSDPKFTDYARRMKYSGKVEVYLWVDEQGVPSHISIAKPAGLGLDEQAVSAVAAYRFQPATQNDKPVKVDLYIDANFQIY